MRGGEATGSTIERQQRRRQAAASLISLSRALLDCALLGALSGALGAPVFPAKVHTHTCTVSAVEEIEERRLVVRVSGGARREAEQHEKRAARILLRQF